MVHTSKNDAHQNETSQIERISSLPEKPNPGSLTILCSVDIFNINAIADLGASVNIMSESILEELSLADQKNANIIVEIADKTKSVSQGIIENVLVKIDKFSFTSDFVIIDTKGLNNKTIILGRPFLANIRVEINISTREVSLRINEDRVKMKMKEQECDFNTAVSEHLNERPTSQDELSHRVDSKPIVLGGQTREKTLTEEQEDPEKCGETKTREIIEAMVNKLPEEWFLGVSRDMDDLEGIIDYLEPTLYDGFIDHNDEAYKRRRNKLLGMPYTEPPPIIKEEAKITKYNLGAGEVFTKTKILNIKGFPRTAPNIADIRAEKINDRNGSSVDLSNTKRRQWCKPVYQWKEDICTKWASCNPHFDECDGGDNPRENKEYWESSNDYMRTNLEWENLSFDNWVKVAFGKGIKSLR
ncbi:zinc knuckle CX2CX4HX4C containing protein [Tanacetum coccineum]